jgi:ankyrin repeat protein
MPDLRTDFHYYGAKPDDGSASRQPHQADHSSNVSISNGLELWRAVKAGQLPRVRYLLKSGADFTYRCEEENVTTPLHQAALSGNRDILEALLEAGANVDNEDRDGATALHYAGRSDVVAALITAGADVDHEDRAGRPPGRRAYERSDMSVVQVLLDSHTDPSKIPYTIENRDEGGSAP